MSLKLYNSSGNVISSTNSESSTSTSSSSSSGKLKVYKRNNTNTINNTNNTSLSSSTAKSFQDYYNDIKNYNRNYGAELATAEELGDTSIIANLNNDSNYTKAKKLYDDAVKALQTNYGVTDNDITNINKYSASNKNAYNLYQQRYDPTDEQIEEQKAQISDDEKENERLLNVDTDELQKQIDDLQADIYNNPGTVNVDEWTPGINDGGDGRQVELANLKKELNKAKDAQTYNNYQQIKSSLEESNPEVAADIEKLLQHDNFLGFDTYRSFDHSEDGDALYRSLQEKYGNDQVNEWYDAYKRLENKENAGETQSNAAEMATLNPVAASIVSVPENVISGVGYLSAQGQKLVNPDSPVDYYTQAMNPYYKSSTIRNTISSNLNDGTNLGKVKSFLYQTGMSMADSAVIAGLSAVGVAPVLATSLLGGSAATSSMVAAKNKGASDSQALATGLTAGVAETLFEYLSLDKLMSTKALTGAFKERAVQAIKNLGTQSFVEGSEEFFTDVANGFTDYVINGGNSDYLQSIEDYKAQGMTSEEATKQAEKDLINQFAQSFLGGAVSGLGFGAGGTVAATATQANISKNYGRVYNSDNDSAKAVVEEALEINPENKQAQRAKKILDSGKSISNTTVRDIVESNQKTLDENKTKDMIDYSKNIENQVNGGGDIFIQTKPKDMNSREYSDTFMYAFEYGKQAKTTEELNTMKENLNSMGMTYVPEGMSNSDAKAIPSIVFNNALDLGYGAKTTQEVTNERNLHLRESSERISSENTGKSFGELETWAGNAADKEIGNAKVGKVTTAKELGIPNGSATEKIYLVAPNSTAKTREASEIAKSKGYNLNMIAGGSIVVDDADNRGCIVSGKDITAKADHPDFDVVQIVKHEIGHDEIEKGLIDVEEIFSNLEHMTSKEKVNKLIDQYVDAYTEMDENGNITYTMSREDAMIELACDARGLMNATKHSNFLNRAEIEHMLGYLHVETENSVRTKITESQKTNKSGSVVSKDTVDNNSPGNINFSKNIKLNPRNVTDEDALRYLENARGGLYSKRSYIPIKANTPKTIINSVNYANKKFGLSLTVNDYPIIINVEKAMQAMEITDDSDSEHKAHGYEPQDILDIINSLDNPYKLFYQKNNDRISAIIKQNKEKNMAIITFGETKSSTTLNGYDGGYYNVVVTIFPADSDYYKKYIKNEDNKEIDIKIEEPSQSESRGISLSYLNDNSSIDEIVSADDEIFKTSREINSEYMKLAEDPVSNKSELQMMVDNAAKENGYKRKQYHETSNDNVIHVFNIGLNTHSSSDYGTPFGVFTKSHDRSVGLGGKQMSLYVKAENTFHVKDRSEISKKLPSEYSKLVHRIKDIDNEYGDTYEKMSDDSIFTFSDWLDENDPNDEIRNSWDVTRPIGEQFSGIVPKDIIDLENKAIKYGEEWKSKTDKAIMDAKVWITKWLKDNGYDSMELEFDNGAGNRVTDALIVLNENQVKSADPVTYDDNGNIIPLSERFNSRSKDIRFSREYIESNVNKDLQDLVNKVRSGKFKDNEYVNLGKVSNEIINSINDVLGIDATGYSMVIEARQIKHILLRHGENGKQDHTMSGDNIAKIEYGLKNYSVAMFGGHTDAYKEMVNGKNKNAKTIKYETSIGEDTLYVIQAVPVARKKTLYIVTSYIGNEGIKKEVSQVVDTYSPNETAKTVFTNTSSVNVANNIKTVKSEVESAGAEIDTESESVNPTDFSRETWSESEYVKDRNNAAKQIAKAIGISETKARQYIDDVNSIAKMIADDRTRLDYNATGLSPFVSNSEYGGSFDYTTLCKKRRLLTGTFSAIQNALPNTALTASEILEIRKMMDNAGLEVSCGKCYVEGSRANMGIFGKEFLKLYEKYYPDSYLPTLAEINTPDGIESIRVNHPEVYEQYEYFWNHYGTLRPGDPNLFASQQKPKLYQMRSAYNGEILKYFSDDANVEEKNKNGGIRMQSFSDFEIVHLIDAMQTIMDMSRVGLNGQAYTKVPDFAWALGNTGLKINLSIDAWSVDENGKLVFNNKEGMPFETAMALRNAYSKNVGTICCVYDDAQLLAALADDRIDFIIPFHRSQWKKAQYKAMGLPSTTKDYTYQQNEKWIDPNKHTHEYRGRQVKDKCRNYMPNEYWDFNKSGKENAEHYLEMCFKDGKRPKFYKFLDKNSDGSYSLKKDGSTDGYWKLLIDFKMYDNDGVGSPQMPVQPTFNMDESYRMLNEYEGGAEKFPVAQGIVDEFVSKYKAEHKGQNFSREIESDQLLRKQNAALEKRIEELTKQRDYWKHQTEVDNTVHANSKDIHKYASALTKETNLKISDVEDRLQKLADYMMGNEVSYEDAREMATDIASDICRNAKEVVDFDEYQRYKDLRKELRATKIFVPDSVRKNFDDWNYIRKSEFGKLNFAKTIDGANHIDVLYEQLGERFGLDYFPETIENDIDQLARIIEVVDTMEPVAENPNSYYMAEAISYQANEIIDELLSEDITQAKSTRATEMYRELKEEGRQRKQDAIAAERATRERMIKRLKEHYQEVNLAAAQRKGLSEDRQKLLRIAKRLKNRKLPAVTKALLNQYIGDLDTISVGLTGKKISELKDMKAWYDNQVKNNPDFVADERIESQFSRLQQKHIKDMSQGEIYELTEILSFIDHEITYNKQMIESQVKHDIYVAGDQVIQDIENAEGNKNKAAKIWNDIVTNNALSPERMVRHMTGYNDADPMYIATKELSDGQRKMFDYQRRAEDIFGKFTNDKKFTDRMSGKNAEEIEVEGNDGFNEDGSLKKMTVKITPSMRISLYLHSLNNDNLRHIVNGGVKVPDIKLFKQGKFTEAYDNGTKIKFSPSQIKTIAAQMTDDEKAFAAAAQKYYRMSQTEINEVSEKLKGYSLAQVQNYFPIATDKNFLSKEYDSIKHDGTIEGMGFTKERVNAKNPIMLNGVDQVLAKSVSQHSKYVGMAIPVRNMSKLLQMKEGDWAGSVQESISKKWGSDGQKYMEKLMKDLQSGSSEDSFFGRIFNKFRSNYAGATLSLNLGVALKQAASYPTAGAIVGWKPLMQAFSEKVTKEDIETLNKYTPLLWYRSKGFSTQELGDMYKNPTLMTRFLNTSVKGHQVFNWIQGMDILTTTKLWKAAEFYVRDNMNMDKRNGDAYYKEVANVYNRIIEETQPNYTTMQRPDMLRTDNQLVQSVAMFKTQPMQNFNVFYDALMNRQAKLKVYNNTKTEESKAALDQANKDLKNATTSQLVQMAVFSVITMAWSFFRGKHDKYKDDEGNVTAFSIAEQLGKDMVSGFAGTLPFGSDIYSFVYHVITDENYYATESVALSALSDLTDSADYFKAAIKAAEDGDYNKARIKLDSAINGVASAAGIPYGNVRNTFTACYRWGAYAIEGSYCGEYLSMMFDKGVSSANKGDYYDLLYKAYKKDKEQYTKLRQMMIDSGDFETSSNTGAENIDANIKKRIKADK